jgi:hypothetical protein
MSGAGHAKVLVGIINLKTVLAAVLTLALAAPSQAQNSVSKQEQYNRGTLKMKVGAILMGTGFFFVLTTPGSEKLVVPAAMGTGMGLVLWGAKDRSDAMRPHIAFGAGFGRSKGLYFSRRWWGCSHRLWFPEQALART